MIDAIVVLNAGSSSLKFAVYPDNVDGPELSGKLERIGLSDGSFRAWDGAHAALIDQRLSLKDHEAALSG